MARSAVLGFPRIGPNRELKAALEGYWSGQVDEAELDATARALRARQLDVGRAAGLDVLPVGDFADYDHVLDGAELFNITAARHRSQSGGLDAHFRACRGAEGVAPLEMTKWFDTNYHYLVPEIDDDQTFTVRAERLRKWTDHLREAQDAGIANARPVLVGPFTLLVLSKGARNPLRLLGPLAESYRAVLQSLARAGAREVQLDEPALVLGQSPETISAFAAAYAPLLEHAPVEVCLATYFAGLDDTVLTAVGELPLAELHVDLVRAPGRLDAVLKNLPATARLSAGIVDGRNVWAVDADRALDTLDAVVARIGSERLTVAPSCSLLHVPYSLAPEDGLDPELRSWLAFGEEKLSELALLTRAVDAPAAERDELLADVRAATASRRASVRTNDERVRARAGALTAADYERSAALAERLAAQAGRLRLPPLPTTTIGSFPQTEEIREARRRHRLGELTEAEYHAFLTQQIEDVIAEQERLGLDVLVHGEPERNDMVEYFGEQLDGFAFSQFGWVQSYGSRAVKPPILYGDVSRPSAMTVEWWRVAQSLTQRPVKGMLTGPVTILQWSFVRDDQPREETCLQIALAIADEVADLEAAGAAIIQIDEAALREGLPLGRSDQPAYVRWSIDCFKLAAAGARPDTQIHTHMCYSEFGEMIDEIARLDADVISIEASRSGMVLLEAFRDFAYPGQIGPGIYDIHSPRVPSVEELESLLARAAERIPAEQLWVNPDCGLKTRRWPETREALANLVQAAASSRPAATAR